MVCFGQSHGKSPTWPVIKLEENVYSTQIPGLKADLAHDAQNDDRRILVPVRWLASVPREQAYWKSGFFANQNTADHI